jgi:hypothetical protein
LAPEKGGGVEAPRAKVEAVVAEVIAVAGGVIAAHARMQLPQSGMRLKVSRKLPTIRSRPLMES